jgi:PAS domain S-box-containing protein
MRKSAQVPLFWVVTIPFLLQVGAAVGLTGWLAILQGRQLIRQMAGELSQEISTNVREHIDAFSRTPYLFLQINTAAINSKVLNLENFATVAPYFWQQLFLEDTVKTLYYGDEAGRFLLMQIDPEPLMHRRDTSTQGQRQIFRLDSKGEPIAKVKTDAFDPRQRPWYTAALRQGAPTWSPIYVYAARPVLGITATMPLQDQQATVQGVLGVDLTLGQISDFLQDLRMGESGQTFIVDRNGDLVATSSGEKPFLTTPGGQERLSAQQSQNPLIRGATAAILAQFSTVAAVDRSQQWVFTLDGERQFLQISPLWNEQGLDWVMAVVIPEADFADQIQANTRHTVLVCGVALFLASGLGLLTSGWISKPILRLSERAADIALEMDSVPLPQTVVPIVLNTPIYEMKILTQSVNQMVEAQRNTANLLRTRNRTVEQLLQDRSQELEFILASAHIGVWTQDFPRLDPQQLPDLDNLLGFQKDGQGDSPTSIDTGVNSCDAEGELRGDVHPEDQQPLYALLRQALVQQSSYEHEFRFIRLDGSIRWILCRGSFFPIAHGQGIKQVGIRMDTTDRKRIEQQLAHLAAIVESSVDAIISTTLDGIIMSWNKGAELIYGYTAEEVIGQKLTLLTLGPDGQPLQTRVSGHLPDKHLDPRETMHRHKEGHLIDVSLTVSAIENEQEDLLGISWISRDVSERRALDRMKNEFVSMVSHELRTPLTSIHGSLTALTTGKLGELSPKGQRLLQIAEQNTTRLIRLINDILDLDRLRSGKVSFSKVLCNCAEILQRACDSMQGMADQAGVTLSLKTLSLSTWVDPDQLIQVITNVISNAIKFSPPDTTVWITADLSDSHFTIRIQDQGRGIPAHKLETIFERFQQVDASDSRLKGGSGLGLAICRSIMHQHGGRIWAESTLGEGSTFFIQLPLADQSQASMVGNH